MDPNSPRDARRERRYRPPEAELQWRFSASGGPGGQHVNTTNTKVELAWDVSAADLPEDVRARLRHRLGDTVTVVCSETRSQWRNRRLAYERLCARIDAALVVTPRRVPTKTPRRVAVARLRDKARRGATKRLRGKPDTDA